MATGMYLGVTERRTGRCDEDDSERVLERSIRRNKQTHQLTLFSLDEATRKATSFCFLKASVSCVTYLQSLLSSMYLYLLPIPKQMSSSVPG